MAEEPDHILLVYFRRMDTKLDRLIEDVRDLKVRMTEVEERQAKHDLGIAGIHRRLDRIDARLDRIERRLDLVEEPS